MGKTMRVVARTVIGVFLLLIVMSAIVYPPFFSGAGQLLLPVDSHFDWVNSGDRTPYEIGILQNDPKYFWGRPIKSELSGIPDEARMARIRAYTKMWVETLRKTDPSQKPIPSDFLRIVYSKVDSEDISLEAALYQVERIAKARDIRRRDLRNIIREKMHYHWKNGLAELKVSVPELNHALDEMNTSNPLTDKRPLFQEAWRNAPWGEKIIFRPMALPYSNPGLLSGTPDKQ